VEKIDLLWSDEKNIYFWSAFAYYLALVSKKKTIMSLPENSNE
jgi:hypothetical protein